MLIVNTSWEVSNVTYPVILLLLMMVLSFLCYWWIENLKISANKMKLKVIEERKKTAEAIIVNKPSEASNGTYPMLLLLLLPLFYFLCCFCVDFLRISAIQKLNWRLVDNVRNKRTAKLLILNTPSGDITALTLYCCCCCCSISCAVAVEIVWIKTVPLNL